MENIEQQALTTFQKNLAYFQTSHKAVYDKIALLNTLIEEGKYAEQYALEYKDEGYFDVCELSSLQYLYNENSLRSAQKIIDAYDLKKTGGVFKAQKYCRASEEQAELIDKSELSFHNALWATIKIINYTKKYAPDTTHMKQSAKVIFLGVGLGLYLQGIIKKLKSKIIFIKEKNLELFRLSLFVTDYAHVLNDRIAFFSLTDDEVAERELFVAFLNTGNNHNLNIKHVPFMLHYQSELQRLQGHVLSQDYINYGYSAILLRYVDSPKYLVQNYAFINLMTRYHGKEGNILSDKPVLMVFSGPSTLKNIEWLIANRDRFIIVSALSTCRLLHAHGIKPNIVVHIDPGENSALLFEGLDPQTYFDDVIAILASNVDEKTVSRFHKDRIYFIEQGTEYKKGFGYFSAPSVGEYTLGIMMILGISDMYMLGVDLALDPDTMQTHGGYHPYQAKGAVETHNASLDPNASATYVKGNFLERIPTLEAYKLSIEQAALFTERLKKEHHHIYNLSNGAYLEDCEPLHVETYDWQKFEPLNYTAIQAQLGTFFSTISEAHFNQEDRAQMLYQVNEAKKLEKVVKTFQKKKYATVEAYLTTLAKLSWDLSDMENKTGSNLAEVYYQYFQIMLSYIYDFFNTEELEQPLKHIQPLNTLLIRQLLKISTTYVSKLESFLKA